jgi:hydroxyacylglutathione hydrolase
VPYDRPFHLLVGERSIDAVDEAVRDLAMIGLDQAAGYYGAEVVSEWAHGGRELATVPQTTPGQLAADLAAGEVTVVDVRGRSEWEAGHLPGVANIPLGHLTSHLDELPRDRPLVLHCQGGGRSSIAAGVLQAHGFGNVVNLAGGYGAWRAAGFAIESPIESAEGATPAGAP